MRQVCGMNEEGNQIIINKLDFNNLKNPLGKYIKDPDRKEIINILAVDVETTGLDKKEDQIIEIGLVEFQYHKKEDKIISIGWEYSSFNDPHQPLTEEIKKKISITNEEVKDKKIDWELVQNIFKQNDIIISHSANFDRSFVDRYLEISNRKVWGCTLEQIDWSGKGHDSRSLFSLLKDHGLFVNQHRALSNAQSIVYLMNYIDPLINNRYIRELLISIKKKKFICYALGNTYDIKDKLKSRRYKWNNNIKLWIKNIEESEIKEEQIFLENEECSLEIEEIPLCKKFKG